MQALTTIDTESETTTTHDGVMDAVSIGQTVRWADESGAAHTQDNGAIKTASGGPFRVGIKLLNGKKAVVRNVTFAGQDGEVHVYLAGPGWVDRKAGRIIRVKDVHARQ